MKINCKLYTEDDIDKLVDLWNENAEWGIIDREQWKKVFYHTPLGPSTIVMATNEKTNEVLAQFVFIPTRINVNGREVQAFKPCAPIVKKSVREDLGLATLFSYILKMYRFATKHFVAQGIYLLHMMPDTRWVRGFQLIPGIQIAHFPLWCLPFDKKFTEQLPDGYAIENISPQDLRINELWVKSSRFHDCSIIRRTDFLTFKLSHRNYKYLGITCNSRIVGFAAYIYHPEIRGIIICDLLAEDEKALKLTTQLTCSRAYDLKLSLSDEDQIKCEKVSILATPPIEKIVDEMGFVKNKYKFSLVVHVLSKELSKKEVSPERWYVSAND